MNILSTEDDDFLQPNSSTLQGLFGPMTIDKSESTDLTYAAPKQPKSVQKQQLTKPSPIKTTVTFAKVVQVYKSVDDSYKIIGKYGLALVSDTVKLIEILLYKDKQNILTRVPLNNAQIRLENNYVSFNDSSNDKWYIQFDEENYLKKFLEELRKANIKYIEVIKQEAKEDTANVTSENISKASDHESDTSTISQTRADILSRMAKMGQSILPGNLKNENNDVKDTYLSSPNNRRLSADSKAFDNLKEINILSNENKKNNNILDKGPESSLIMNNSITPIFPYTQGYLQSTTLTNTTFPSQEFNMLVSENRMQNSEVRMNLTVLSSKLDTVLSEISKIKEPPNTDKLENEFLKSKIIDLEKQINNLTKNLNETNQNSSTFESLIMNKNEEIENEKRKVSELQNRLRNMEDLESRISIFKLKENELNTLIKDLQQQIEDLKGGIKENDVKYAKLQEINDALVKDNENLNDKVKSIIPNSEMDEKMSQKTLELEMKCLSNIIKESMNLMYQNIMTEHEKSNETLQQTQFKFILSTNIKQATFNVIERFRSFLEATDNPLISANTNRSE